MSNLWVRSQDKKKLTECHDFALQEKIQGTFAVLGGNYPNHILGIYKNKQRALEVLDDIQRVINGKWSVPKGISAYDLDKMQECGAIINTSPNVYIMPME